VYDVKKCSDYPEGGSLESTAVTLYNDKFQKVSPTWYTSLPDGKSASPQCNYGAYLDGSTSKMTITTDQPRFTLEAEHKSQMPQVSIERLGHLAFCSGKEVVRLS